MTTTKRKKKIQKQASAQMMSETSRTMGKYNNKIRTSYNYNLPDKTVAGVI